ncbi:MAG: TetR/AcrR family transcriptional regulator [Flavitalea sp.]
MAVKDSKTEQQIKDAAKRLFFVEGRFKATTQEIADAAGVNRTLVNYYFRSRDTLFAMILADARATMEHRMDSFAEKAKNLREKLAHVIDIYTEQALEYPFLDTYLITQNNAEFAEGKKRLEPRQNSKIKELIAEIELEMEKGNIRKMSPYHFFMNFTSMMSNPVSFHPMYKELLHLNDKKYKQLMLERKEIILGLLFEK